MGEAKVNVKLSNSMDVGMFRRGLITREQIRTLNVDAFVDTSAVRSCIPVEVKEQLGLETVCHITAQLADGSTHTVEQTEAIDMEILGRIVPEACLVLGSEVLIGQTALEATDLHVDCSRQKVIPHPDHPHATVIRIR